MSESRQRAWRRRGMSRRAALRAAGVGLTGIAAASLIGCGESDEDESPPAGGGAADATASPTSQPTSTPTPSGPRRGGVLQSSASSSPAHFDQHQLPGIAGDGLVYNQLLRLHRQEGVVPDLAEHWESPDENSFVFTLRPGVRFHDRAPVSGREMTAEDVVFSIDRARTDDPNFTNRWMWTELVSLDAIDDGHVRAVFDQPFAPALFHFAATSMSVLASETLDEFGDLKEWESRIGTGPFVLDTFRRDDITQYRRNPNYFNPDLPYLDGIDYPVIPDRSSRVVAFRSGQIDHIGFQRGISDREEPARGLDDVTVTVRPSDAVSALGINHAHPALADTRVRQALALAVDHHEVIRGAGGDEAGVVRGMTHPHDEPFALPIEELEQLTKPNVARAAQLIQSAGLEGNLQLAVSVTSADPVALDIATILQQQFAAIGVDLTIDPQEGPTWIRKLVTKSYELIWIAAWTPALDPGQQFHGSLRSDAAQNWWNANVPEIDEVDAQQVAELDIERRAELIRELERLNFEHVAALPVFAANGWVALRKTVRDYEPNPAANGGGWERELAWLDA